MGFIKHTYLKNSKLNIDNASILFLLKSIYIKTKIKTNSQSDQWFVRLLRMPAPLPNTPAQHSLHFLLQIRHHRLPPLLLDGVRVGVELVAQLHRLEVELPHRLQGYHLRFHFPAPHPHYRHFPGGFIKW